MSVFVLEFVFVEVKARSVNDDLYSPYGTPSAAVTKQKQLRTVQAARGFLHDNPKYNKLQNFLEAYYKAKAKPDDNDGGVQLMKTLQEKKPDDWNKIAELFDEHLKNNGLI